MFAKASIAIQIIFGVLLRFIGIGMGLAGLGILILWTRERNKKYSKTITELTNHVNTTLQNPNNGYIVTLIQGERVNFNFIGAKNLRYYDIMISPSNVSIPNDGNATTFK